MLSLISAACASGGSGQAVVVEDGRDSGATTDAVTGDVRNDVDAGTTDAGATDAGADPEVDAGPCAKDAEGPCEPEVACAGTADGPVKVFLVAGQSNMVGTGVVTPNDDQLQRNGGMGTLKYLVDPARTSRDYDHLVGEGGKWVERDDVWIVDLARSGPLTVGYGGDEGRIGPELEFGHVVGDFFESPVLLIKTAWGGKSLHVDFRPPSAGGEVGPSYTEMVQRVHAVLDDIAKHYPGYNGQGFELAGIAWHQGWNDRVDQTANDAYQDNAVHLINDLRAEFGVPRLPFALATTGMTGWEDKHPRALSLMNAQLALPDDTRITQGRVAAVETRDFWRPFEQSPANQGFHWNQNAETFLLIGGGLGKAMVKLVEEGCASEP